MNSPDLLPDRLRWRVHTPNLLREILKNPGTEMLKRPLQVFASLLSEVGERAAEIDDPRLNALMCILTIYSIADPTGPDYDPQLVQEIINAP